MNSILLTILLMALLLLPIYLICRGERKNKRFWVTVYMLILIWLARFWISLVSTIRMETGLTPLEIFFDSILHTLQTFSMDEDYTLYTVAGKEYLISYGYVALANAYGFIISAINICAPILGGALVLSVITDIFAKTKLTIFPFRHKFVFSELNDATIELAQDILRDKNYKKIVPASISLMKPMIIFTDVYPEEDSEPSMELILKAKNIGAICVKDDIRQLSFYRAKSVDYFLMDMDGQENLTCLSDLLKNRLGKKALWTFNGNENQPNIRFFITAKDDFESVMIRRICDRDEHAKQVLVRTVRDQMNTAFQLMNDVPLFLPLLGRKSGVPLFDQEEQHLGVAIIGSSVLAEEILKAVYWCAQIVGVKVDLYVVAAKAESYRMHINEKYPELLKSCQKDDDLLRVHPFGDTKVKNPPYLNSVTFVEMDEDTDLAEVPEEVWNQTLYYAIAVDDDKKAVEMSNRISSIVARKSLVQTDLRYAVIAPAIDNDVLAEMMREINTGSYRPSVIPFASLSDRYSCGNVFMTDVARFARTNSEMYSKQSQIKIQNDEYTYWANIARPLHAPYKLFALGMLRSIDLDKQGDQRWQFTDVSEISAEAEDLLAWMEHRRWCAFIRSQGFVCPTKAQYDEYYAIHAAKGQYKLHKDLESKFHPCLVETHVTPYPLPETRDFDKTKYDYLDYVAMYNYHMESQAQQLEETAEGLRDREYRKWDYRQFDSAIESLLEYKNQCK